MRMNEVSNSALFGSSKPTTAVTANPTMPAALTAANAPNTLFVNDGCLVGDIDISRLLTDNLRTMTPTGPANGWRLSRGAHGVDSPSAPIAG